MGTIDRYIIDVHSVLFRYRHWNHIVSPKIKKMKLTFFIILISVCVSNAKRKKAKYCKKLARQYCTTLNMTALENLKQESYGSLDDFKTFENGQEDECNAWVDNNDDFKYWDNSDCRTVYRLIPIDWMSVLLWGSILLIAGCVYYGFKHFAKKGKKGAEI